MLRLALPILSQVLLLLLGVGTIAYLGGCLFLYFKQARFIFLPSRRIETTPVDYRLAYQEVRLPVRNGRRVEHLHGWWMPAADPNAQVVLHLHGNGINIGANMAQAYRFRQLGLAVLLADYRGYGQSEGPFPSEARVYEDAQAMWTYLTQTQGIAPSQILIYGHSLGGAVAIDLAKKHPNAGGLIVQSSFSSMRAMVSFATKFDFLPIDLILTERFNSLEKVVRLRVPVLYIHGLNDTIVPAQMSQKLYAASPEPKQLYLVPDAGHNDVAEVAGWQYQQRVRQFIQSLPTAAARASTKAMAKSAITE